MKLDLSVTAPIVEKRPKTITQHNITRTDDYAWLRADNWRDVMQDPSVLDPDIRAMLETENDYYQSVTAPLKSLTADILEEMKGRIEPTEADVPTPDGAYAYYHKYREGDQHGLFMRARIDDRDTLSLSDETALLDADALAKNYPGFFNLGSAEHSPNHQHLAYSVDSQGAENYEIFVQTIGGDLIKTNIIRSAGGLQWARDSRTLFWIERDENQRPCYVYAKDIFAAESQPRLVYKEDNPAFFVSVSESDSGRFIEINVHNDERFYILTNYNDAVDFQIMSCPANATERAHWNDYEPHIAGRLILSLTLYQNHLVRVERENALPRIVITQLSDNSAHNIEFDEQAYSLGLMPGLEYETQTMRFSYSSPTTPSQIFDYDMNTRARVLRKTRRVPQ